jgi:hypothetical protein
MPICATVGRALLEVTGGFRTQFFYDAGSA